MITSIRVASVSLRLFVRLPLPFVFRASDVPELGPGLHVCGPGLRDL